MATPGRWSTGISAVVRALLHREARCARYAPGGPTSAQQTFDERRGVCAGYSALLHALAEAADQDVGYVAGVARDAQGQELGRHAWNVAHIDRQDLPIDVTWDAGHMADSVFVKRFSFRPAARSARQLRQRASAALLP